MKLSLDWLGRYVDLQGLEEVDHLTHQLTFAGVEVEEVLQRGGQWDQVVVARIVSSEPHPNADRLSVCQVEDGSGEPRQIVCGATNYKVGDKVPLALPGAVLPGNFKIKTGKLRGVKSEGMMCSAKELELGGDAGGLLILDESAPVGVPLREVIPPDVVLDIEVTPNRPDLLSHTGVAREISVLTRKEWNPPEIPETPAAEPEPGDAIRIEEGSACRFYSGLLLSDVQVGPSPEWLVRRLESVGLRPINNVVDVTNFVLMELGQPLHAFDTAKLSGGILVRPAKEKEELLALDGVTYRLNPGDTVIADSEKALALGGIMGGEESGVTESTKKILLESAWFEPAMVRRSSRRLGISTDSSYRFERGVDPGGVLEATRRAAQLLQELAGARIEGTIRTVGSLPSASEAVSFRYDKCRRLLGADLSEAEMDRVLVGFGLLQTEKKEEGTSVWRIPSHRMDLHREVDLIEEIARVTGLERVAPRTRGRFVPHSASDARYDRFLTWKRLLAGAGLSEVRTSALVSVQDSHAFEEEEVVALSNPLSSEQDALRKSLVGGLLAVASHNRRMGRERISIFQMGRVYHTDGEGERMALLVTGPAADFGWREHRTRPMDLFDLKGVLQRLLDSTVLLSVREENIGSWALRARIGIDGEQELGWIGLLRPAIGRELDLEQPVWIAEIDLDRLFQLIGRKRSGFQPLPRFPAVVRDVALVAPVDLPQAEIPRVVWENREPLLDTVELFDLFQDPSGEKLEADKKSLAYSLTYRASDRTLTAEEVSRAHQKIMDRLAETLPVTLRT